MGYSYDPAGTTPPYKDFGRAVCTVTDLPPDDDDTKVVSIPIPLVPDFRKSGAEIVVDSIVDKDGNPITATVTAIPTADPVSGPVPLEVTLDGNLSTGPIVKYSWRIVENDAPLGDEAIVTSNILAATTLTYELTVTSVDESTSVATVQVTAS